MLLLCHVLSTQLAKENRTHRNEQKITKTILIVNFCLLITWLPDCIAAILTHAFALGGIHAPFETKKIIGELYNYFQLGIFINSGLNACIYLTRTPKLKAFYKALIVRTIQGPTID